MRTAGTQRLLSLSFLLLSGLFSDSSLALPPLFLDSAPRAGLQGTQSRQRATGFPDHKLCLGPMPRALLVFSEMSVSSWVARAISLTPDIINFDYLNKILIFNYRQSPTYNGLICNFWTA
jgi:hypothetical protein